MKLMYELPEKDKAAFEAASGTDEKLMYCLPFDVYKNKFVDGFMAITDKKIYKILNGELLDSFAIQGSGDFHTEVMYGSCGFYASIDGSMTLLCQFMSGRNLPRYSVIAKACEILSETDNREPITNDTPERFCPTCARPFVRNSTICPYCIDKKEVYRKLWAMTKGLRLMMSTPFFVSAFHVALSFINPWIQATVINNYLLPIGGGERGPVEEFVGFVFLIVGIDLFSRVLGVTSGRISAITSGKFSLMLKSLLYEKIQALSLSSIQRRTTGELMGRVSGDTAVMQSFITSQLPNLFVQIASFFIGFVVVLKMNPLICMFIFIPIPLVVYIITVFWKYIRVRNRKSWVLGTRARYLLHDILNGIRVVKSFGQEEREISRFKDANVKVSAQSESNAKMFDTLFPILNFAIRLGSYLIMIYGNIRVFDGRMGLGTLHQFNAYAGIVYAPLLRITSIPTMLSQFLTSSSKVFEILEEEPEVRDIDLPLDIKIEGDISIRDITFGYQSYNPVLENISAEIKAGEMIGIVGHSGSGKTTLINLIMRLYDVNEGAIVIDDVNIKDISQTALRSQIGVVLQETFLFSGTIRDNIRYSKPYATDEEVIRAARVANAHDFIINMSEGYNTMVGEKGYSLSGGERQRIAIARAIIHNPRILILDEATASLDTETEKLIQDALNKLVANRTTLAIAHRLSTLRNADRLLVLDHGKLSEFGTHNELLDNKGIYYKLVMAQRKMAHDVV
ncbi:MAG: ABC transporter ATP-binding protein [Eubacteriales bacterium]|jgi:ATP-binding cassette subfamily B protein|nr:ABC transporter ATP-binding protein [Eubacteriales bacterium]